MSREVLRTQIITKKILKNIFNLCRITDIKPKYKTNRCLGLRVYSDNAQMTSKSGKITSHASRLPLVAHFYFLPTL